MINISKIISVDEKLKRKAIEITTNRMNYGFREEPKSQPLYKYNMILTAVLGELIFEKYLNSREIDYKNVEGFDYSRYFKIGDLKVEVKTSAFYNDNGYDRLNLLYNINEYNYNTVFNTDYVVQIFVGGKEIGNKLNLDKCDVSYIAGSVEFDEIPEISERINYDAKRPHYKVNLDNLAEINAMI